MRLSIIACIGKNRAIGFENKLLWHLPDDLFRFRELTINHPVIMGRKTFESIGRKPLPHRQNIILSKNFREMSGYQVADSLEKALSLAQNEKEIFVIGGEKVYEQTLSKVQRLYLTEVNDSPDADAFFPKFDEKDFDLVNETPHSPDKKHKFGFSFKEYERK